MPKFWKATFFFEDFYHPSYVIGILEKSDVTDEVQKVQDKPLKSADGFGNNYWPIIVIGAAAAYFMFNENY